MFGERFAARLQARTRLALGHLTCPKTGFLGKVRVNVGRVKIFGVLSVEPQQQTGAPRPVLKLALSKLTRRNAYLAAMAAGGSHYDIDGKPAGVIGPDDQKSASEALQRQRSRSSQAIAARKARWEAKQAAAAAQP